MLETIQHVIVPIDNEALKASPIPSAGAQLPVFGIPSRPTERVEVLSVAIGCQGVIVVDATDTCFVSLVYHSKSASSNTTLLTGAAGTPGDLKAAGSIVLHEPVTIWSGAQSMSPGDSLYAPLTITTPDTAGDGYFFVVTYKVREYSGQ